MAADEPGVKPLHSCALTFWSCAGNRFPRHQPGAVGYLADLKILESEIDSREAAIALENQMLNCFLREASSSIVFSNAAPNLIWTGQDGYINNSPENLLALLQASLAINRPQARRPANSVFDQRYLASIFEFSGARVAETSAVGLRVEWKSARAWRVSWRSSIGPSAFDLDVENALSVAHDWGECAVTLDARVLCVADRADLWHAMDIQRRRRLSRVKDDVMFNKDDDFVRDVKLHILKFLQAELESSSWGRLVRASGAAPVSPLPDELLARGPHYGEEAFHECTEEMENADSALWLEVML